MKMITFNPKPVSKPTDWVWLVKFTNGQSELFHSYEDAKIFQLNLAIKGVKTQIVKDIY